MFFPADNGGCRKHAEKNHLRPHMTADVDDDEATIGQTPDRPAQFILEGIEISATQGDWCKDPAPSRHVSPLLILPIIPHPSLAGNLSLIRCKSPLAPPPFRTFRLAHIGIRRFTAVPHPSRSLRSAYLWHRWTFTIWSFSELLNKWWHTDNLPLY